MTKPDAEEQYNNAVQQISKNGPFQEIKVAELNNRRNERLEAMEAFDKKTKKQKRKKKTEYWKKLKSSCKVTKRKVL